MVVSLALHVELVRQDGLTTLDSGIDFYLNFELHPMSVIFEAVVAR